MSKLYTYRFVLVLCALLFAPMARAQDQIKTFTALSAVGTTGFADVVRTYTRYQQTESLNAPSTHIVQAFVTGTPTTCSFQLFGSLKTVAQNPVFPDDFFQLTATQDCSTVGLAAVASTTRPALTVLINLVALSGGTSPSVSFVYVGKAQ